MGLDQLLSCGDEGEDLRVASELLLGPGFDCASQTTAYIGHGVANTCNSDAASASGRFLHLEQSTEVRMEPEAVAAALLAAE